MDHEKQDETFKKLNNSQTHELDLKHTRNLIVAQSLGYDNAIAINNSLNYVDLIYDYL